MAFTSTDQLAEYLVAASGNETATLARLEKSRDAVALEAGTKAQFLGYSGAGQARVRVTTGPNKDRVLYVSYAVIQQ
jgi:hypothetical protein